MNTKHRKQLRRDVPVLTLILIAYFICAQAAYGQKPVDATEHSYGLLVQVKSAEVDAFKAKTRPPHYTDVKIEIDKLSVSMTFEEFARRVGLKWPRVSNPNNADFLIGPTRKYRGISRYAHAQGKPPVAEIKPPASYVLNAESSQRFIDLENQKMALRRQYADVVEKQDALLMGANVPAEERKTITNWQPGTAPPWEAKDGVLTFKVKAETPPISGAPRP